MKDFKIYISISNTPIILSWTSLIQIILKVTGSVQDAIQRQNQVSISENFLPIKAPAFAMPPAGWRTLGVRY
ncbi:MAG: hypothetical protein GY705_22895 [Bacteroidetes bacterium]|nr:hypothetical protein [Bacteroidota bacterium]